MIAGTLLSRLRGLLGRDELPDGQGLQLTRGLGTPTWFMRLPIDVLFLTAVVATAAIAAPVATASHSHPKAAAQSILAEINTIREEHGLRTLRLVRPLTAAAVQHSTEMGSRGYFSHRSADGTSFAKRVEGFYGSHGYHYWSVGENLLWSSGTLSPAEAVTMWMNSPPHRQNLLEKNWRQIGVSVKTFSSAPGVYHGLGVTIVTADFGARY